MSSPNPVPSKPLRSAYVDDPEMVEIVEAFVNEMPARLAALEDAWTQQHLDDLRRMAHQLKGSSGGYGFQPVGSAAADLERTLVDMGRGSAGGTVASLRREFEALTELCRRVSM